jgi:predicted RNA binding protein YcfA (HicA-like mRNA interferase family)
LDKKEALLAKARNHKRNVSPQEIVDLLIAWGFHERAGRGDHRIFNHSQLALPRPLTIPSRQNPLHIMIVTQVLSAIQELQEQQND